MISCRELGTLSFEDADRLQRELGDARARDAIPDTVLLLEHPPVYTYGKQNVEDDFIKDEAWRRTQGIAVARADRGGRLTYHGPGQLVGYLILKLAGRSVPILVGQIEAVLIALLKKWDIEGKRDPQYPGVWVKSAKIAAIGLHISKAVTRHGFSLNVSPELAHYHGIIPCGIPDRAVTSMEKELGIAPPMAQVIERLKPLLLQSLMALPAR